MNGFTEERGRVVADVEVHSGGQRQTNFVHNFPYFSGNSDRIRAAFFLNPKTLSGVPVDP